MITATSAERLGKVIRQIVFYYGSFTGGFQYGSEVHFLICLFRLKESVSRDGYFFLRCKHFNLYFVVCADGFQGLLQKLFTILYKYKLFICFFGITYYIILKMLTESLLRSLFSLIDRRSQVSTPNWLQGK